MTPLAEVPVRRAEVIRANRDYFLSQPDPFFREVFEGRVPSSDEKLAWAGNAAAMSLPDRAFRNDTYEVQMRLDRPLIHLAIRRHDDGAITKWRDFQQIKNELIGPEHEAVELFPAESRLIDTSNQYHLWVFADRANRFPLGWWRRCVLPEQFAAPGIQHGRDQCAGKLGIALEVNGLTVSSAA